MDPSSSMGKRNNNNDKNNNNNIPVAAAGDPAAVFKCPRCESTNTKFCYYNNYSLSQPRHFCKACKRYWTRGGTLRNVPVGGGCRKHKKRPPPYNHGIPIQKQKQKEKERERDLASPTTNIIINNIPNPPAFLFSNNTNNSMGLHFPFSTSGFGFGLMDNNFSTTIQLQGHNKYYSSTTTTTTGCLMKEFIDDEGAGAGAEAVAAANHTFPGSLLYDHKNSNMQINYEGTAKDDGVTTKILMDDDQEKYNINNHMIMNQHVHDLLHTDTSPSSSHLWNTTWYDPSSNYMGSSVPSLI